MKKRLIISVFWIALAVFLTWDWLASDRVDTRQEPAAVALDSDQAPSGGHCASTF